MIECPKESRMLKIMLTSTGRDKVWGRTGVIESPNAIEPLIIFAHLISIYTAGLSWAKDDAGTPPSVIVFCPELDRPGLVILNLG